MNAKQFLYSQNKVIKAKRTLLVRMFLFAFMAIAIPSAYCAVTSHNVHDTAISVKVLGGTSIATMAAIGSIDDVTDTVTVGNAIGYEVWFIDLNQVDTSILFPTPNVNREVSTIPLISGEYMHYFQAHAIPDLEHKGTKGDVTINPTNTLSMIMGGYRDQLLNFAEQYCGGKFIVIFREAETTDYYIIGNIDKPMVFKEYDIKHNKDSRSATFTFESVSVHTSYHYVGAIISQAIPTLVPDATALAIGTSNAYNVPAGSAATYAIATLSGLSPNDKGRVITLYGVATQNIPTIADNTAFILEDGATWTAKAGSKLTLRVLDIGTLVEVQGTRVQTV
jgi:hypothetical protein